MNHHSDRLFSYIQKLPCRNQSFYCRSSYFPIHSLWPKMTEYVTDKSINLTLNIEKQNRKENQQIKQKSSSSIYVFFFSFLFFLQRWNKKLISEQRLHNDSISFSFSLPYQTSGKESHKENMCSLHRFCFDFFYREAFLPITICTNTEKSHHHHFLPFILSRHLCYRRESKYFRDFC